MRAIAECSLFEEIEMTDYVVNSYYVPIFEKLESILVSTCPTVRASVHPSVQKYFKARVSKFHSSIRAPLASFQDGRHGSKMAARTPRWPPRPLTTDDAFSVTSEDELTP